MKNPLEILNKIKPRLFSNFTDIEKKCSHNTTNYTYQ